MNAPYLIDFSEDQLETVETDVIVIGAGIAGLYTSILASAHSCVTLITKKSLYESNTRYAQGGIAAVISGDDSPIFHLQDTLIAGAGLCSKQAVNVLVYEGPERVQELISLGTSFDLEDGELALTQEGAHSHRRILHAHGDATGYEIVRSLAEQVRHNDNITIMEDHYTIDLLVQEDECRGALIQRPDGTRFCLKGKATVLCTGGTGHLYRYTTNPEIATGDGIAMAYRAGAILRDLEFNQFHPTALCYPGAPRFLISEAVRGEGAVLRNIKGERFMNKYHAQLELAPRDVVARAIVKEMEETQSTLVYLDITHEPAEKVKHRFPTIYKTCLQYGLDLTADWIPVAPAAHYMMGGVRTDLNGETSIQRLFACGESSSTGVHGANRLASNSLSEAIVFGKRIVDRIKHLPELKASRDSITYEGNRQDLPSQVIIEQRLKLQKLMMRYVGLTRSEDGLTKGLEEMRKKFNFFQSCLTRPEEYEFANMLTCGMLMAESAYYRQESRGGHYREDTPQRDNINWQKHTLVQRDLGITEEIIHDI